MNTDQAHVRNTPASPTQQKPTISSHPELAREIIHRLVKSEDWSRANAAQWSLETIKHIALFCATGMAGSFAAMQIPKISAPIWHTSAGGLFFVAFATCIYRMHLTAVYHENISRNSKKQFEDALWGKATSLEDLCHKESKKEKNDWNFIIYLGWIASGIAVIATACLLTPIVWPQIQR